MAVNRTASKSLFVNTNFSNKENEPSTMLLLLNAVSEAKNKNIKKANVEFNQSFLETKEKEELFLSKVLELEYQDLEALFLCICGSEKNRRSSKQQEKRGSLKKSSVGDLSFSNSAYENELKLNLQNGSLGRKRSQVSLNEESIQGKNCLRKAYYLRREIMKVDFEEDSIRTMISIHLKAENYYPCVVLLTDILSKPFFEPILISLDDSEKFKMGQICVFVVTNVIQNKSSLSSTDFKTANEHAQLACKLMPNEEKPFELLCKIYRKANETSKALAIAKTFLEEVNKSAEEIIIQKVFCLIDNGDCINALHLIESTLSECEIRNLKEFTILKGFLSFLSEDTAKGMDIFRTYKVDEHRATIVNILEQFHDHDLRFILHKAQTWFQQLLNDFKEIDSDDDMKSDVYEAKRMLMLVSYLLSYKNPDQLSFANLHVDCLVLCGEYELAQAFLVKLVKDYPEERLPMVYLANLRLKLGAYVAATEDFRTLYMMWGMQGLLDDLSNLPIEDRREIARVHRLHGFRFFNRTERFHEAAECFSVAISAIGLSATGLFLSRGFCYIHMNDYNKAIDDFNKCLHADDSIAAALCARAVLYAVTTHVEEAILDFQKAFSIDASACQQCLTKLPMEHALTFGQLIIQYIKQELEETTKHKKTHHHLNDIHSMENISHHIFNIETVKYSEFLCKVFPNNTDYVSTYIEALYVANESSAAHYETNSALNTFPGNPLFVAWKGVFLTQQRKFDDATTYLKDMKTNAEEVLHILSYLDQKMKKNIFDKVTSKARTLADIQKHGEALAYYNIASMLYTKDVASLRGRMECHYKIDETKKWLRDLGKVINLQPTADDICLRAQYYRSQGEELKACEDYIAALAVEEEKTIEIVTINSNGDEIVELFYSCAWCMIEMDKHAEVLRLCNAGLKFDPYHKNLKQLRDKTRSNVSKCVIQ